MIFCRIYNQAVIERAVFDDVLPEDWPNREAWIASNDAQVGWGYVAGEFIPPPPPEIEEPEFVLANLEPDQFWMALRFFGYETSLRAWVAGLQPTDVESETYAQDLAFWSAVSAKLEWAKYFERDHPMIEGARQALGITEQQLDNMWMWALS